MKIKAIHKKFGNRPCVIEPVFFPKESGLAFGVREGDYAGSWFACGYEEFTFDRYAEIQIFFVMIWYYLKMNLWRKLRHQWPYKVRCYFRKKRKVENGFPF